MMKMYSSLPAPERFVETEGIEDGGVKLPTWPQA